MKHKDNVKKLRSMESADLEKYLDDLRRSLFSLRLNSSTSHVKDISQFKKLRRMIACSLTVLSEKSEVTSINKEHINE